MCVSANDNRLWECSEVLLRARWQVGLVRAVLVVGDDEELLLEETQRRLVREPSSPRLLVEIPAAAAWLAVDVRVENGIVVVYVD